MKAYRMVLVVAGLAWGCVGNKDAGEDGTGSGPGTGDGGGTEAGNGTDDLGPTAGDGGEGSTSSPGDTGDGGSPDSCEVGETGESMICFGTNAPAGVDEEQAIAGTVTRHGPPDGSEVLNYDCYMPFVDHVLEIEDADGALWWLAYGVYDSGDEPSMPMLDVEEGVSVQGSVARWSDDFYYAGAFVLRDDRGLVAFIDIDAGGRLSSAVGEVAVTQGASCASVEVPCGFELHSALVFESGDDVETLAPGERAVLDIEGTDCTVSNIDNYNLVDEDNSCTEGGGVLRWAVWRDAE